MKRRFPVSTRRFMWRAVLPLGSVIGFALGASAAGPCPPSGDPAPSQILVAQLASVGHAENAVGTLVVRRTDGRVEQLRGRGSLPLREGDELRTERGSRAFIRLADGTQLAMNEETTFTVRGRADRGRGLVRLFRVVVGELWLRTAGAAAIEVETPAATAAIKGTEFNLRVHADGKTVLTVVQGLVELKNESCSPCAVAKASLSVVERGRRCSEATPADPASVVRWIAGVVE